MRDTQGAIIIFNAPFLPQDQAHGLIDFTHPDIQNHIIQQAIAVSKCGLYDGVFMDWWSEDGPVLRSGKNGFEAEQRARDNIIKGIRNNVRPDFLIMVNTNKRIIPRTAPYINGAFMETRTPGTDGAAAPNALATLQRSLSWLEQNLREPRSTPSKEAPIRVNRPTAQPISAGCELSPHSASLTPMATSCFAPVSKATATTGTTSGMRI